MSCAYKACASPAADFATMRERLVRPGFWRTIVDVFHEALDMRRAAHRSCFLGDE